MDADKAAKSRVDLMFKSITRFFPDLDGTSLRFAISDGFTEIALSGINEEVSSKSEYTVEYWFQHNDDYDFNQVTVEANSRQEAIEIVKSKGGISKSLDRFIPTPRGAKSFSIVDNE